MEPSLPKDISLGAAARSAVVWNTAFSLFRDLLQFGTMLAMVRMVPADSYGAFGAVTSFIALITVFSATSFYSHMVQVAGESEVCYQEHFTAGLFFQGGACAVTNILALVLRLFPDYAPVSGYLHVMSVSFLLDWPCQFRLKMLERSFAWKRMRMLQGTGVIAGAVLGLGMAWMGWGAWALLIPGMLVTVPFIWDLFIVARWRPNWQWSLNSYRPALKFGSARIASNLCNALRSHLPVAVMPVLWSYAAIGLFGRATGLAQLICSKLSSNLITSVYPVLTRLEAHGRDPGRAGGLLLRVVVWTGLPVAFVLAARAPELVTLAYGSKWDAVIPLMPWASAWGLAVAVSSTCYFLLLSRGETRRCFTADLALLLATVPLLLFVIQQGAGAYLAWLGVATALQAGLMLAWLLRLGYLSARALSAAFIPPVAATAAGWAVATLAEQGWRGHGLLPYGVFLWMAVFSLVFTGVIRVLFAKDLHEQVCLLPFRSRLERLLGFPSIA